MRTNRWPLVRDWAIYGAGLLGVGIGVAEMRFDPRWEFALLVLAIVALNVVIKVVMPKHTVLARMSWIYIALTGVALTAVAVLWANPSFLGAWTIPALIAITVGYSLVHMRFGPY